MKTKRNKLLLSAVGLLVLPLVLAGCPQENKQAAYDRGFDDGFAEDDEYWKGYFDGYDTTGFGPIWYDGHEIPFLDEVSYDAGYYDGLWYAYNDGYWVNYHDAFIIGWSEGYDRAFRSDYLNFLAVDEHIEYLHGGWSDGYEDGFSEGRVFGAYDFEQGLDFDWADALFDYEEGVDLYFEEVDVGTGEFGPVFLYEYGDNPHELVKSAGETKEAGAARPSTARERFSRAREAVRVFRSDEETKEAVKRGTAKVTRPMIAEAEELLDVKPSVSERSGDSIEHLDTTWLERILDYSAFRKMTDDGTAVRDGARTR